MKNYWIDAATSNYVKSEWSGKKNEKWEKVGVNINIELMHEEAEDGLKQLRDYAIKLLTNKSQEFVSEEREVNCPDWIKNSKFVKEWQTATEEHFTYIGEKTTRDYIRPESGFANPTKGWPGGFNVRIGVEAESKRFPSTEERKKDLREMLKASHEVKVWPTQVELEHTEQDPDFPKELLG